MAHSAAHEEDAPSSSLGRQPQVPRSSLFCFIPPQVSAGFQGGGESGIQAGDGGGRDRRQDPWVPLVGTGRGLETLLSLPHKAVQHVPGAALH